MKKLPIGIQTFGKLREEGYLYIDKTESIYKLLEEGSNYYFLSRPRRFGKSLMVSIFKEIFAGNKKLFENLWIYDKLSWDTHPVIHMDFSGLKYAGKDELSNTLEYLLKRNASNYGVKLKEKGFDKQFKELIQELSKINSVVILVDEYDKPIIDHIEDNDIAKENRDTLRTFYESIKDGDPYIKFAFITGVSKISKVSIFSGLNNLTDITLDDRFAGILGYTDKEVEEYFKKELNTLAKKWKVSGHELREKVKRWYNGYSWDGKTRLYNPVSLHNFISKQSFSNYWFSTATPTFLVKLIMDKEMPVEDLETIETEESDLGGYDVDHIELTPLLFQAGYLTVSRIEMDFGEKTYYLSFPNQEVKESFLKNLFKNYTKQDMGLSSRQLKKLKRALIDNQLPEFFKQITALFASLSYDMSIRNREGYYQTVIYLILKLIGIDTEAEIETNQGRIDTVIQTDSNLYIMEYKMGSAQKAMDQIKEKKYYQKYQGGDKSIVLVGVGFDIKEGNISDYQVEILS